jgi:hypothetical protein
MLDRPVCMQQIDAMRPPPPAYLNPWTLVGLRLGPEPRHRTIDQNPFGELFLSELGSGQRDLINELYCAILILLFTL